MNKEYFLSQFKPVDKKLEQQIVEFIKDKSVPLDDRWEVYTKTPKDYQSHDACYPWLGEFESKYFNSEIPWFNVFERREIIELNNLDLFEYGMFDKVFSKLSKEEVDEAKRLYKECAMGTGVHTALYDW